MKRPSQILFTLLFFFISLSLFAAGAPDMVVVSSRGDIANELALEAFNAKYPGVTVEFMAPSMADGSTVTMDSLIEEGTPPNVYTDYMGRVSKYMRADLALDLNQYIKDQDDFIDGMLDMTTIDGKLLGLPLTGGAQGMAINMKMLDEIGYGDFVFDGWTVDEFLDMCAVVKETYGGDKWGTGLFAGNQSGDYLWMNWLSSFGATVYGNGYNETSIDSPEGVAVFTFWKSLLDSGYVRADSAIQVDDDYVIDWARGDLLATAFYPGWIAPYFDAVTKQGLPGADFETQFVAFPRAPGVEIVPAAGSMAGVIAIESGNPRKDKQAAYMAWLFTTAPHQKISIVEGGEYATRKSITYQNEDPYWQQIAAIVAENGKLDLGITQPFFSDVRAQGFPRLQALLTGAMTPEEAVEDYAAAVNAIIGD